ncbi:MAG: AAA family ATPase [Actinomycetota bacterium]
MSQVSRKNPYRPGVGTRPLYLAGRQAEIGRFGSTLRAAPEIPANVRLTGLRGVGKTVLLSEFETSAREMGWIPVAVEVGPRHNREASLAELLEGLSKAAEQSLSRAERVRSRLGKAAAVLGKVGVTYGDVTFSVDTSSEEEVEVGGTLAGLAEAAAGQGLEGAVLLLDEAQVLRDERAREGEHPLSLLLSAVNAVQKTGRPLGLVVCGLPTLTANLLHARSYSERMFRGEEIGPLDTEEAREALQEPLRDSGISADPMLVAKVLESVEGYPYFIQLWGAELWDAARGAGVAILTRDLLDAVEPEIYRRLDLDFYDPRIQTLTPAEQDILLASAECAYPPLVVADIRKRTEKTPGNVNVLLGRLVESGVLYRVRKGQYRFTAPKFHDYLKRKVRRLGEESV